MERAAAIKKLGKLLGKKFCYEVNSNAPTREERQAAQDALPAAREQKKTLEEQVIARRNAILEADDEYQALVAAEKTAREKCSRLVSTSLYQKITVGVIEMGFFSVKAEGDSWEEVIEKVTAKQKVA